MTLLIIIAAGWIFQLDRSIQERIKSGWFLLPVEIYSAPQKLEVEQTLALASVTEQLSALGFRQRSPDQVLLEGDWTWTNSPDCHRSEDVDFEVLGCLLLDLPGESSNDFVVVVDSTQVIKRIIDVDQGRNLEKIEFSPLLFAQYYDESPILRRLVQVGQVPLMCLQAVTAIEDSDFLEHKGVSVTGTFRAVWRNLVKGRFAEGGSTITQQLVKNYFLTGKKTISRKITEQVMALLLEARVDKDTILENYLNVIYMGANGPFQVRGFAAASEHYFQKPIEKLNLSECALLAAVVNSPGRYNPFTKAEPSLARRNLVLTKMAGLNMIDPSTLEKTLSQPLPKRPPRLLTEPAPYFVQAVLKKIQELKIDTQNGLKIYTTLNISAQELTQTRLLESVKKMESDFKSLSDNKKSGNELQAAAIVVDVPSAQVLALVGGRTFSATQYNRAIEARRQIGSVIKPFVFLAALETQQADGTFYNPLTRIDDSPLEHKYDSQSWSPKNYDGLFRGPVPMYYALKSSLNAATARLGIEIGISQVVDIAKRFGIESPMAALPSLTLGAVEMSPWEIARAYTALAHFGLYQDLAILSRVTDAHGDILFEANRPQSQVVGAEHAAALIGMLKHTMISGTGQAASRMGFTQTAAGKTGTTSDNKDAWFVGFTPEVLTAVWVGYDDNTPLGLTGASAALPIWTHIMTNFLKQQPDRDFQWPEGTHPVVIRATELRELLPATETPEDPIELIFRSSDQPFDN